MRERTPLWAFLDGAAAFSFSMLVCLTIRSSQALADTWGIQHIHNLTLENDGLMAATILLLFPSAAFLYGGIRMIFAAREAVEKKALEKGIEKGRADERQRILNVLDKHGVQLPPNVDRDLNNSNGASPQT